MMNLRNKKTAVVVLFALLAGALWAVLRAATGGGSGTPVTVERTDVEQKVTISGTVEPRLTSAMGAPYDGYIKEVFVKQGQKVKKGQPLFSVVQALQSSEAVFPLRAPFDGTIVQVLKEEGQAVKQTDKDPIVRIDDLSKMFILATVPEIEINRIKIGQQAVIRASAILDHTYTGLVQTIALASKQSEEWSQRSQVSYLVRVEITDPDQQLKSGMSAIGDIVSLRREGVLALPHEYLRKRGDEYVVTTTRGEEKTVKVGIQNESLAEITEGLTEGEQIRQVDYLQTEP